MNNKKYEIRPEIVTINNNEPLFYSYSIVPNKCRGSCDNINDPYETLCVPDVTKNISIKLFNLMSRSNETRDIYRHKTCKCKCRLDVSVRDNKQRWNKDKWRYECKELIDECICDKRFIWNPSICEWGCDKLSDIWQYLDYKDCKCRKKLIDQLVEECSENIDENEMIHNGYRNVGNSCVIYIGISSAYFNFHWYFQKDIARVKFNNNLLNI